MDPIRIALIGASGRAVLSKHWHRPGSGESILVGAADTNPVALKEFQSWAGEDVYVTDDYQSLLARPDIDAVGVFSPDNFHEEHALAVLRAGKHLFLEKPMCLTTEACDRILAAWEDAETEFMVGFNMRYMPIIERAKELIDRGSIGTLKAIWVRHFVGAGSDFYFHDWHGLRENSHSMLLQKGSHDIDVIHWLSGAYSQSVAAYGDRDFFGGDRSNDLTCKDCPDSGTCSDVQAEDNPRQQCAFREEIDIEDNQVVIMRMTNGVKAAYLQCHFAPEYCRNYTMIGTQGRIEMEVEPNKLWLIKRPHSRVWEKASVEKTDCSPDLDSLDGGHGGADPSIAQAFMDMIRGDAPALSDPLSGRMSVAVGCAAVESLREGGMKSIPLPKLRSTAKAMSI